MSISAIKNLSFIINNTITLSSQSRLFQINYQSLGTPSCASIKYQVGKYNSLLYTIGTSLSICATYFGSSGSSNYLGNYQTNGSMWYFYLTISSEGLVQVNVNLTNAYSNEIVSTQVVVSGQNCGRPELDIENRASFFYNPAIFKRSKLFSLVGFTTLSCNIQLNNSKSWTLYNVNESTGVLMNQISLSNNPSSYMAELVIQPNTLAYGLYRFSYVVQMSTPSYFLSQAIINLQVIIDYFLLVAIE